MLGKTIWLGEDSVWLEMIGEFRDADYAGYCEDFQFDVLENTSEKLNVVLDIRSLTHTDNSYIDFAPLDKLIRHKNVDKFIFAVDTVLELFPLQSISDSDNIFCWAGNYTDLQNLLCS